MVITEHRYVCRRCGITVFGFKRDRLCTSCRCAERGEYKPREHDRTNDEEVTW